MKYCVLLLCLISFSTKSFTQNKPDTIPDYLSVKILANLSIEKIEVFDLLMNHYGYKFSYTDKENDLVAYRLIGDGNRPYLIRRQITKKIVDVQFKYDYDVFLKFQTQLTNMGLERESTEFEEDQIIYKYRGNGWYAILRNTSNGMKKDNDIMFMICTETL